MLSSEGATGSASEKPGFGGELAELYQRIAVQKAHFRGPWALILAEVNKLKPAPGSKLLDVASGDGEPALTIAKELPNIDVISTDVAPMMTQAAEAAVKQAGVSNVRVQAADAQDLSTFESDSVDVVTCCHGYMFCADKSKAFSETYRVLKPGGTLIATVWERLSLAQLVNAILTEVVGHAPPPHIAMTLAGDGILEQTLEDTGFRSIQTSLSSYPISFSSDPELQYKYGVMTVKDELDKLDAHETARRLFFANTDRYFTMEQGELILKESTFKLAVAVKPEL